MIKAIFFDLDGTLLGSKSGRCSEATKAALAQLRKQGILLFAATGRAPLELKRNHMIDDLQFDAIVALNGQLSYTPDEVIHSQLFDKDDLAKLLENIAQTPCPCVVIERDDMYINYIDDSVIKAQESIHSPLPKVQDISNVASRDVAMLMIYLPVGEQASQILRGLEHSHSTRWHAYGLDILPNGCSKKTGIDRVLNKFGLSWDEVMAFGDGENDYEMLKNARYGVAMGNADPLLLAGEFYITDDADSDGVVSALRHFELL